MNQFELTNVRLYGQAICSLGIKHGQIIHIGDRPGWLHSINGQGHSLFYGRIDPHVHDRDPGFTHKEDKESIQAAAIAGGTTTIVAQANTNPCLTTADRLAEKVKRLQSSRITYQQWFGATPSNYRELKSALAVPGFVGVKLCLATTTATGDMLVDKEADQTQWCNLAADHDVLLTVHAENEARITRNQLQLRQQGIRLGLQHHCTIRDPESETEAVAQILDVALAAGLTSVTYQFRSQSR
ncbi:MAG TPA: dihydroorotase family protein [Candidatus Andersenbacteria bacterium]|nr:dihydroorotase family protein [Candidatus Andersenbacteria bacterium]